MPDTGDWHWPKVKNGPCLMGKAAVVCHGRYELMTVKLPGENRQMVARVPDAEGLESTTGNS